MPDIPHGSLFPVLPLRDIVVFPHMIVPLFVGRDKSVRALEDVMRDDKQILLVAQKDAAQDDPARRFISLVDELYDQAVNLYIAAVVPLDQLYSGGALSFEFRRTFSRLSEMQSVEYINSGVRI